VRPITTIKCQPLASFITMLAAEHYPNALTDGASLPTHELLEIHRSKISLHRAKVGYDYPTIRLPHTFSKLAGLSMRIYQTICDGSLAFLTVISPTENASKNAKSSAFTRRRSPVRIRPSPLVFVFCEGSSFRLKRKLFKSRADHSFPSERSSHPSSSPSQVS
jgi:hypothetical protein